MEAHFAKEEEEEEEETRHPLFSFFEG